MRLRCSANRCPIEVPDDLVGARIRCPHCGALIVVDAKDGDYQSVQVQPGEPAGAPNPKEVSNLENQIYDGLPPLSVMMELRRRKGRAAYDADELSRRYPMTEDDWKALAAFEEALHASAALTTAYWIGLGALIGNVSLWVAALDLLHRTGDPFPPKLLSWLLASALGITVGVMFLRTGAARMSRIMLGVVLEILPWSALALAALFGATAAWYFVRMESGNLDDWLGGAAIFSVTADLLACLASCVAGVRAWIALRKIRPPEIAHRLIEALKYLA
jgi:DNA-directed RNA polymerase subunit RPC12/RpoP